MAYDKSGNIEARNLLELLAINPNFAAALGVLAVTHMINYVNGWGDLPEGCLKTGLEIAERAIQIDEEELKATLPLPLPSFFIGNSTELSPSRAAASPWHAISHKDIRPLRVC